MSNEHIKGKKKPLNRIEYSTVNAGRHAGNQNRHFAGRDASPPQPTMGCGLCWPAHQKQ